ncbi:MAG TPA: hypothetical protein ENI08_01640 [Candidatus Dependentiae bacterium]|nr:hypothetical protein [Candidatus Dependentiae bacterium]
MKTYKAFALSLLLLQSGTFLLSKVREATKSKAVQEEQEQEEEVLKLNVKGAILKRALDALKELGEEDWDENATRETRMQLIDDDEEEDEEDDEQENLWRNSSYVE